MTKEVGIYNRDKAAFSVNGVRKTEQLNERNQTGLLSHTIHKNKLRMD